MASFDLKRFGSPVAGRLLSLGSFSCLHKLQLHVDDEQNCSSRTVSCCSLSLQVDFVVVAGRVALLTF